MDIDDAIDAAAGNHDDLISSDSRRALSASRRTSRARATITRFLDAAPDELTVFELREMLEQQHGRS